MVSGSLTSLAAMNTKTVLLLVAILYMIIITRGDSPKPKTFRHDYATYKNVCREMDWVPKCDCHKETKKGSVAFSVYQLAAKSYKEHETLIYDTVLVNDGNHMRGQQESLPHLLTGHMGLPGQH
ncbi:uncharacterized protein LOC134274589 [Saccostrea cucullata]|uniref:uncharacterized protein LOC134274589 n=1 Tax=Saccostrea cuccullata TaxID=36930 RepID=UPI002ED48267